MQLKRLALKNVRSYVEEEIIFPTGSLLLSGDIGAGKSTILHAIELALFGLRKAKLPGRGLLRHGAMEGFVELEFSIEEKTVIIHRSIRAMRDDVRQEGGFLTINGRHTELTAQELTAQVLEMLGYPFSLLSKGKNPVFTYTVYTPQEEMKHILLDEPDNRIDILRKVFGMDKYKQIQENTIVLARSLQERVKQGELMMSQGQGKRILLEQKKAHLLELQQQTAERKEEYERVTAQENASAQNLTQTEKVLDEARSISMKRVAVKERVDAMHQAVLQVAAEQKHTENMISSIRLSLQQLPTPPHDEKKAELMQRINTQQLFVHQLSSKKNILEERKEHLFRKHKELSSLATSREQFMTQLTEKQREYDTAVALVQDKDAVSQARQGLEIDVLAIMTKAKETEVHLQHVQNSRQQLAVLSSCPTCFQEVGSLHKKSMLAKQQELENELQNKYQHLAEKKMVIENSLASYREREGQLIKKERIVSIQRVDMMHLEQNIKALENVPNELVSTAQDLVNTEDELELLGKQNIHVLYAAIEDDKKKLTALEEYEQMMRQHEEKKHVLAEKELQLNERRARKQEYDMALQAAEQEERMLAQQLNAFTSADAMYSMARKEHDACIAALQQAGGAWSKLMGEQESLQVYCSELEAELEQLTQLTQSVQRMKSLHTWLSNFFSDLMMTLEKHLFVAIHRCFAELFQYWFVLLMEEEGLAAKLDDMFTPVIVQNGYEVPFEHLSGGERTSCALAYRLALNKVINDVQSMIKTRDLLILDEPTEGFSADQLDRVRLVLDDLHLSQLIVVSHESKIEGFVDHVLRVVKNEQGSKVIC